MLYGRVLKLALLGVLLAIQSNDLGVLAFHVTTLGLKTPQTSTNTYHHEGIAPFGRVLRVAQRRIGTTYSLQMTDSPEEAEKRSKRQILKANIKKIITYPKDKIRDRLRKIRIRDGKSNDILGKRGVPFHSEHHTEALEHTVTNGGNGASTEPAVINGSATSKAVTTSSSLSTAHERDQGVITITESEPTITSSAAKAFGSESLSETSLHSIPRQEVKTRHDDTEAATSKRSATAKSVDLSGKWELIVTEEFKASYDKYLQILGQPPLVRSVALSIIGMTTEETIQSDEGRELKIRGRNVRGNWERTLKASSEKNPLVHTIVTADKETVESECWWEENGSVHRSWLRGVEKYGGGDFESRRFLEDNGETLVCESTFHPFDSSREKARIVWRFKRMNEGTQQ